MIAAHSPPAELAALRRAHPALDDDPTLAAVRRRGWAMNDREIVADVRVVGAPILDLDGYPLAALIVCGPTSRITLARLKRSASSSRKRPEPAAPRSQPSARSKISCSWAWESARRSASGCSLGSS